VTPYADHFGSLCGMEVVLPDGSLLRTGNTTETPNRVWNLYKWGVGPYLDGLFAQSNLGIVVKAGIWLMPEPEAFDSCIRIHEVARSLPGNDRGLASTGVPGSPEIATAPGQRLRDALHHVPVPQASAERAQEPEPGGPCAVAQEHGVSPWTFGCGLYGTAQDVRSQRRALRKGLGKYGRLWSFGRVTRSDWIGRVLFQIAHRFARLAGKSPAFLAQLKPGADLFRGIPTDEFVKQVYFKSHPQKPTGASTLPRINADSSGSDRWFLSCRRMWRKCWKAPGRYSGSTILISSSKSLSRVRGPCLFSLASFSTRPIRLTPSAPQTGTRRSAPQ